MIRYALKCEKDHSFDMWFADSGTYDTLAGRSLVSCPDCGSTDVRKAIMAPGISSAKKSETPTLSPRAMAEAIRKVRAHVMSETTDMGRDFPNEALRMHEGDVEARPIRGEATPDEVKSLVDDGVPILPVPPEPPKEN